MKIVESLNESGLLIKSVNETIKKEAKKEKENFWNVIKYFRC